MALSPSKTARPVSSQNGCSAPIGHRRSGPSLTRERFPLRQPADFRPRDSGAEAYEPVFSPRPHFFSDQEILSSASGHYRVPAWR